MAQLMWGRMAEVRQSIHDVLLGHHPTSTHIHTRQNELSVLPDWGKTQKAEAGHSFPVSTHVRKIIKLAE